MRLKKFFLISQLLAALIGLALCVVSVFAVALGIDNDAGWGKGRILLLLVGLLFLLAALALHFHEKTARILHNINTGNERFWLAVGQCRPFQRLHLGYERIKNRIGAMPLTAMLSRSPDVQRGLAAGLGVVLVLLVYNGMIHSHYTMNYDSNYYDQLADGFLAGHTWLPQDPPQALCALENPYDWRNREGIQYLWDATLYQCKYYLYWGAVPALIAAGVKAVHPMIVLDQTLVMGFCTGISIMMGLLIMLLHKKLFPRISTGWVFLFTVLGGLAMPVLWLTLRPSVYEAAISSGQFFLLLGLYAALRGLWKEGNSYGWLLLTGFAWGAAFNSRLNLLAAMGWMGLVLLVLYARKSDRKTWFRHILVLALPLILWALAWGGYNMLRFGSPLDTGHHYQLDGPGMPHDYSQVISSHYILPSLYSYLIRPLQYNWQEFPFIFAPYISESMWPFFIRLPEFYYYPEPVAGILFSLPVVWLAFLPALDLLRRLKAWLLERSQTPALEPAQNVPLRQVWWLLGGAAFLAFLVLLMFNVTSMRYLADVLPMLILLSLIGLGWGMLKVQKHNKTRNVFRFISFLLVIVSLLTSILAGLSHHA